MRLRKFNTSCKIGLVPYPLVPTLYPGCGLSLAASSAVPSFVNVAVTDSFTSPPKASSIFDYRPSSLRLCTSHTSQLLPP